MIVANEHSRVDPVSTFGLDITECLAIVLHKTVGIDSIEAALEDFSLDRAFYLSEGYEGAQADKRWSAIMAALQSAVFQRDGHVSCPIDCQELGHRIADNIADPPMGT